MSISFPLDKEDEKNLALIEAGGLSRIQAIRVALANYANSLKISSSIAQESELLAKNQKDLAEIESIRGFFSGVDTFG